MVGDDMIEERRGKFGEWSGAVSGRGVAFICSKCVYDIKVND